MSLASAPPAPQRAVAALRVALVVGFAVAVVLHGWVCDDAFIILRVVRNLLAGDGLVWNVGERVQVVTSPAWLWLLSAAQALTGEGFFTTIAVSAACSAAAVWLVTRDTTPWRAVAFVAAWLGSRAAFDFSSSGLEPPLLFLVLALLLDAARADASPARLGWLFALALCVRLDAALLTGPWVAWALWRRSGSLRWTHLAPALLLAAWFGFALVYFGSPWPNTAVAKLSGGVPRATLVSQGAWYVVDCLRRDAWTALVLCLGLVAGARRDGLPRAMAVGLGLHVAYVVWIGGDFMSGRFLAPAFFLALALLTPLALPERPSVRAALGVAGLLALASSLGPWANAAWFHDVVDERRFYLRCCSVEFVGLSPDKVGQGVELPAPTDGVVVGTAIGLVGYRAAPGVHVVDTYALADAFLARQPVVHWRVGHGARDVPAQYVESVRRGENVLPPGPAHALLDDVWQVTRGPLFTAERWRAITRLHGLGGP